MVLNYFESFERVYMSFCDSRALQDMQQIAISEGPVDLKIVSQGSLCINRASLLHPLDIF